MDVENTHTRAGASLLYIYKEKKKGRVSDRERHKYEHLSVTLIIIV